MMYRRVNSLAISSYLCIIRNAILGQKSRQLANNVGVCVYMCVGVSIHRRVHEDYTALQEWYKH